VLEQRLFGHELAEVSDEYSRETFVEGRQEERETAVRELPDVVDSRKRRMP